MLTTIAVISDTHNRLPDSLTSRLAEADEIWHLGDVCSPEILLPLEELAIPLVVVRGNMDPFGHWPERRTLDRRGTRFHLQHFPPTHLEESVSVALHGHLHFPIDQRHGDSRILSPGAVTNPRNGSSPTFGWLSWQQPQRSWSWELRAV